MATLQSLLLSFQRCSLFRRLIWSEHTRNCTARRLDFHRFEHEERKNGPRVELGGGLAGRLSCSKHAINLWLFKLLSSVQNDGERVSSIAKKSNIFCLPSHLTVFLKIILRTAKPLWLMFCFGPLRCNDAAAGRCVHACTQATGYLGTAKGRVFRDYMNQLNYEFLNSIQ